VNIQLLVILIFVIVLFLVLGIHFVYPQILKRLSQKSNGFRPDDNGKKLYSHSDLPPVSILIPVYNEELAIEQRINNIFEGIYPKDKLEIIVIDSGSSDRTRSIIESNFKNDVTLITEQERRGKAHAINLGLKSCKGEIIILTDGTTLYDKETILHIVSSFKDNTVGAVSAFYDVPNSGESHVTASERKFWSNKDNVRLLESNAASTSWLSGEACAFRNKIIDKVHEDTLADDSNIALQVISKGYRVVVNQNARFIERSPTQFSDYIKIKSRRALGGLIETIRFKSLLFNRDYGYFGTIIFPYRFFVYLISPILSCFLLALAIPVTNEIISYLGIYTTLLIGIALILMGIILRDLIMTYLYTHLFTIIALIWLISGNTDVRWTRSRTR
jgi:poly-beta-1,6-N-acetyl-D-glucosamine synthase